MTRATRRFGARHLAAATTFLTFLLILLGVYTAATGAGLACSGQWPACDGGLLPQTIPSFIEWFHRFVAMIAGFAILGTAVALWRSYDETRIRGAGVLALVATPLQVLLGGATVIQYTPVVQTAHHGVAMLIFGSLLAGTLWAFEASSRAAEAETEADVESVDAAGPGPRAGRGD
ncbi:cytochrome AA3 biosynthesis protein [Halobacteriales archaeon QS_8_69_26]|nr:MAG: cytochrome AA3 biosynthesis protein [Halobacteriales archaeon QS_8_69_26]